MGEEGAVYSELPRPTRNQVIEKMISGGQFGSAGAGLETIAAGAFHSLAVSEDGAVWSFGNNETATLGRQTTGGGDPVPRRIDSLLDEGFRAVRVVAEDCSSAALSDKGELRAWGLYRSADAEGVKAFSPTIPKQSTPGPIPGLADERFAAAAGGHDHLVLLTTAGEVYTVGCGDSGQLGYRVPEHNPVLGTVPHKVLRASRGHRAVVVGAGGSTSFFVDEQGVVWGWGLNDSGQTGTGKLPAIPKPQANEDQSQDAAPPMQDRKKVRGMIVWTPQRVKRVSRAELGGGASVVQIAGGDAHTLFLTSDGRVFACGSAWDGQLGGAQDPKDKVPEPVPVPFPHDVKEDPVVQIACGPRISAAVTRDGVLYTWGSNTTAQIGVKDVPDEISVPTVVVRREGGWRTKVVACGSQHCLALLQKKAQ
ncbi:RCC1/BLIP-II [Trametes sanguinea]|nr:RCC1/BLIP-II [Trametes sanguinea]